MSRVDVLKGVTWTPYGGYCDFEPPELEFAHRRCWRCKSGFEKRRSLDEMLIENGVELSNSSIKKRLLRENRLENRCYICGLGTEWNNKPLTIQLDHINGNAKDWRIENLRMLCPNCHTQTDTFCGRNNGNSTRISRRK